MSQRRTRTRADIIPTTSSGSRTTTTTSTQTLHNSSSFIHIPSSGTLHLRAEAGPSQIQAAEPERRIHWAEDVVNNEGMGKKSSKVCCIYHKPREVGESSSESSSDSSSDDDSDDTNDDGAARPTIRKAKQGSDKHGHGHEHDDHNCHDIGGRGAKLTKGKGKKVSTNAYERQPKND